jgi:uncharacterized repeat protein (TIGR01451 family)
MRLKNLFRLSAVVAVVMTVGLIAGSAWANVWTDRNVYQAGDTVSINGDGMQAGESVGVEIFLPDASLAQHHDVAADDQGNFSDSYTLPADAPSGDYTVVATGAESGNSYSTTFDPIGAGALNCPTLPIHNPTHYKLQVGTSVTCTIDGASEVSGQSTTTVYIKSSALGNTAVTGTVTGTGTNTQITFSFTAPGDGCDTTIVAYDNLGLNSNNTIISGPGSPAAAGFAYVDGNGNVIDCGGGGEAHVSILKVADEPQVNAGDVIGFTITVTSDGTATALGVQVSDTLPTDAGTSWSIDGGTGAGDCAILAGVLSCDFGGMASPSNLTVHITSPTTKATVNYSPVVNTATVTSDNAGSDESTDQVEVICPKVQPSVIPDAAIVQVGNPAGFTVKVTRKMAGTVHSVITVTTTLPKGMAWSLDGGTGQAMCSMAGNTLTCNYPEMGQGTTYTAHVTAVTAKIGTLTAKTVTSGVSPLSHATAKGTITVL